MNVRRIIEGPQILRILLLTGLLVSQSTRASSQVTFTGTQFNIAGNALNSPAQVSIDSSGNLYVADRGNNRIVMLAASGNAFAAPIAILSDLSGPSEATVDWSGDVFISDSSNNRILMLKAIAGGFAAPVVIATGLSNPSGLAVDLVNNVYIADRGNNRVVELPSLGDSYGALVVLISGLNQPASVAVDSNKNLYIADTGNNRILREPFTAGTYPTQQVVGRGFISPQGVAVDRSGNVYISDTGNHQVVKAPWVLGRFIAQSTVSSSFDSPAGITVDNNGNIYVADQQSDQLIEIVPTGRNFNAANLNAASQLRTYNFLVNQGTTLGTVGVYTQGTLGKDFVDAGGSSCIPQTYSSLTSCWVNIAFIPSASGVRSGALVLNDSLSNLLATEFLSGTGVAPQAAFIPGTTTVLGDQLSGPAGVAVDGFGNVYIADTGNDRIVELPWTETGYGDQTTISFPKLSIPMGLAFDGQGSLYVASNGNDKVLKLPWLGSGFGQPIKVGSGFYGPSGVAIDSVGNVYVADTLDNGVRKVAWTGTTYATSVGIGNYHRFPTGIAVNGKGTVFYSMPYDKYIAQSPWSGSAYMIQSNLPSQGLSFPSAIAVDGNSNLYVVDTDNNRVLMLPWNGSEFGDFVTVATGFNAPAAIAIDIQGNLYVADTANNRVVKIDQSVSASVNFVSTYIGSMSADSAKRVQVENIGNEPLTLSSLGYPADFTEGANSASACFESVSLSQSSGCDLSIDFLPQTAGSPLNETVNITSNSLTSPGTLHTIQVTGTGLAKLTQTVSFSAIANTTYGTGSILLNASATSGLPVSYQVVSGPAILASGGRSLTISGHGTVVVQALQVGNYRYSAAPPVTASFIVAPAVLKVTPVNSTAVYGAIPTSFNYTVTGFVLGQSATRVLTGAPRVTSSATAASEAGTYTLAASIGTLSSTNYTFVFGTGTLTITKASLRVAASSVTAIYGSPLTSLPWAISGFVNGDSVKAFTGIPAMTPALNSMPAVGSHTVTPSLGTLQAANYTFTFATAVLTVTPAVLTVKATDQQATYGGSVPALTFSVAGFVHGDSSASAFQGSPALSTNASAHSPAGVYAISVSPGTLSSTNYTFKYVAGSLIVAKARASVVPGNVAMTYGHSVPTLPFTFTGLVNGDTPLTAITGQPTLTSSATAKSLPGNFAITASIGTLMSSNYSFKLGTGTIIVSKALLTVTPRAASMTYGGAVPTFAYDYAGFINGDDQTTIQGKPMFTTTATPAPPVGTYTIAGALGTLSSQRYSFKVQNGTLSVIKANLAISPANVSMSYGSSAPALTFKASGLVNGDKVTSLSGSPTFTTKASSSSVVGSYTVQISLGTLSSLNYSFSFTDGQITITKALVTVTPHPASLVYGSPVPVLTCDFAGFANHDTSQVISGTPKIKTAVSSTSPVGSYPVSVDVSGLSAINYSFAAAAGVIKVTAAPLSVSANNQAMLYGNSVPQLSFTISGFVNGEAAQRALSGVPALTTTAAPKSPVGSYAITAAAGSLTAQNYTFTFTSGSMKVNKAPLVITANDRSMTLGAPVPPLTYSATGLANDESLLSATGGMPSASTKATPSSTPGTYPIVISQGKMNPANYALTLVNGTLTVQSAPGTRSPAKPSISPSDTE